MEEIWRDIKGYEGLYQVSSLGSIKNIEKNIYSKLYKQIGYLGVDLTKNKIKKRHLVHRLVAKAFIPNVENKAQVNHINGLKDDNRVGNLEWCTARENNIHAIKTGLKVPTGNEGKAKRKIRCLDTGEVFESIEYAHRKCNLPRKTLWLCCQGKRNKTGGLRWE